MKGGSKLSRKSDKQILRHTTTEVNKNPKNWFIDSTFKHHLLQNLKAEEIKKNRESNHEDFGKT